jgi:hypothetical protein
MSRSRRAPAGPPGSRRRSPPARGTGGRHGPGERAAPVRLDASPHGGARPVVSLRRRLARPSAAKLGWRDRFSEVDPAVAGRPALARGRGGSVARRGTGAPGCVRHLVLRGVGHSGTRTRGCPPGSRGPDIRKSLATVPTRDSGHLDLGLAWWPAIPVVVDGHFRHRSADAGVRRRPTRARPEVNSSASGSGLEASLSIAALPTRRTGAGRCGAPA